MRLVSNPRQVVRYCVTSVPITHHTFVPVCLPTLAVVVTSDRLDIDLDSCSRTAEAPRSTSVAVWSLLISYQSQWFAPDME